jgi:hypothetical protein
VPSKAFAGIHKPSFAPFQSDFTDTPPSTPLRRPDWFCLAAAPIQQAVAKPEFAAACFQTCAASDGLCQQQPKCDLLVDLGNFLVSRSRNKMTTVLILDEAHHLSEETLTGTLVAPGQYDLTSGTVDLTGSAMDGTGILVPIENNLFYAGGGTELFNFPSSAGGNNWASGLEDAVLFPNQDPQLNAQWGALTFAIGGFNTTTGTGPRAGLATWSNGPGNYGAFGGNLALNIGGGASFSATEVPEGGATLLYLLLAGAGCFGAMFFRFRNGAGSSASA